MGSAWVCTLCSTTNSPTDGNCVVCDGPRPTGPTAPMGPSTDPTMVRSSVPVVTAVNTPPASSQPTGAFPRPSSTFPSAGPAGPPSPPTASTPPATGDADSRSTLKLALLGLLVAVLAVGAGVGAFLLVSGDSATEVRSSEPEPVDLSDDAAGETVTPERTPPTEVEIVTTTTEPPVEETRRAARIGAGRVKVRTEPSPYAAVVAELSNAENQPITILGRSDDRPGDFEGWHAIELDDGRSGYLYAGLILPPEPGWCVAVGPNHWIQIYESNRILIHDAEDHDGYWTGLTPAGDEVFIGGFEIEDSFC